MIRSLKATLSSLAIWMSGAIVVGVVACFVLDVVPLRRRSSLAAIAIWLVLGVFVGFLHYSFAQSQIKGKDGVTDWDSAEEARTLGGQIVVITAAVLAALSAVFYPLFWSSQSQIEVFFLVVPDNVWTSVTFFIAILLTTAFANHVMRPTEKPPRAQD